MSRNGTLLPLPDPLPVQYRALLELWPSLYAAGVLRSYWLGEFEDELAKQFPSASRADLNLTARHYAPFPLTAGKDVP